MPELATASVSFAQPARSAGPPLLERLLTKRQAGELLSVSERTIERLLASGALPAVRIVAGLCRIDPIDLRKFIDQQKGSSSPSSESSQHP